MFEYRLEAPGVQPAHSMFQFIVSSSGLTPWQPLPNVTPTGVSSGTKGLVPLNNISGRTDIVIAISVIASVLMIIITAILFVKCRMGKDELHNKRSNGHLCQMNDQRHRKNSHFDDIYDSCARSAIMSLGSDQQIVSSPRLTQERYTGNGTLPRHVHTPYGTISGAHTSVGANLSDSDSWMESSRSRETSPSSSIPPSLPAFRVIPLCESESSGTHLSDPPPMLPPMFTRNSKEVTDDPLHNGGSSQPPLLRKNQYWV